jgi:predicted RNA binding protein YcfA (HicA-like mRNA interferase family)
MGARRRQMTAHEVTQVLSRHGFEFHSQRGSHEKWLQPGTKLSVIVPMHKGKTLPIGTLRAIQKGSGLPDSAWETE